MRARLAALTDRAAPSVLAHGDLHLGNALFAPDDRARYLVRRLLRLEGLAA